MPETAVMPVANPDAELPRGPASLGTRVVTIIAIVVPLAGIVAAPFYVWGWGFRWTDLALLVGMYVLTAFGITIGFHRLFVHRSFETYMWIKVIFAVLGSMALQGPLLKWVGMHRWHHQHSDTPDDPYSPQHGGAAFLVCCEGSGTHKLAGSSMLIRRGLTEIAEGGATNEQCVILKASEPPMTLHRAFSATADRMLSTFAKSTGLTR